MNIIILYLTATAAAVASTNSTCASIKGYVLGMGSDIGTKSNIPDVGACCTDCQNNVRLVFLLLLHRDTCNLSSPTQRYARPPSFPDFRGIPILFLFPHLSTSYNYLPVHAWSGQVQGVDLPHGHQAVLAARDCRWVGCTR